MAESVKVDVKEGHIVPLKHSAGAIVQNKTACYSDPGHTGMLSTLTVSCILPFMTRDVCFPLTIVFLCLLLLQIIYSVLKSTRGHNKIQTLNKKVNK